MFLGPTGVGKTKVAKACASCMFDNKGGLVRIDMNEFRDEHTASRLIGAPPGYLGYGEGGQLTEAVRQRPFQSFCLMRLKRRIEMCSIFFLRILDEGKITDSQGRAVSFTNTVIIMTSNGGSQCILNGDDASSSKELGYQNIKQRVMEAVRSVFRPEFMNRVDEYIVFHPLDRDQINNIVRIQLERVQERIAGHKMKIQVSDAAVQLLGSLGYDPSYGARPVKRVVQQHVETDLANGILSGKFQEGSTISVDTEVTAYSNGQCLQQKLVLRMLEADSISPSGNSGASSSGAS